MAKAFPKSFFRLEALLVRQGLGVVRTSHPSGDEYAVFRGQLGPNLDVVETLWLLPDREFDLRPVPSRV